MPRESVMSDDGGAEVKVGWSPQGCVQVGVGTPAQFKFTNLPPGVTVGGADEYTDLWASLNRQGCNDLIRKLRKARDAAFGRDE